MKVHCINDIAPYHDYCDESAEFSKYELNTIKNDIEELWYWYSYGCYEGAGAVIARVGDQYSLHDCGHCSCYGPLDNFEFYGRDFDTLRDNMSKEAYNSVYGCLIEYIEKNKQ